MVQFLGERSRDLRILDLKRGRELTLLRQEEELLQVRTAEFHARRDQSFARLAMLQERRNELALRQSLYKEEAQNTADQNKNFNEYLEFKRKSDELEKEIAVIRNEVAALENEVAFSEKMLHEMRLRSRTNA